jgi:site-specific DNA-methyltransferase (adenine-specific)
LIEWLIKTYTNEGETVLDNCMGSGTTAEACINTGRNYIGFETDEKYYENSLKRINMLGNPLF